MFMFGSMSTCLFESLYDFNPFGEPPRSLGQSVAFERCVVHRPARCDHVLDQRVQRTRPSFLSRRLGLFRRHLNINEHAPHFV
jgi:hypothetical protein